MKRQITAWAVAVCFVAAGFSLAGCPPRQDTHPKVTVCISNGTRAEHCPEPK